MSTKTTRLTRQMTAFMGAESGTAFMSAEKSAGDEGADEAAEQVRVGGLSDKRLSSCGIFMVADVWSVYIHEMLACIGLQTLAATKIQSVMRRYAHLRSRPAAREVREYIDSL